MSALFLDIVSEDIPVFLQRRGESDLWVYLNKRLRNAGVFVDGKTSVKTFVTPRRLAAVVKNLPTKMVGRRNGPWADADNKAIEGFLRAHGIKNINDKRVKIIEENGRKRLTLPPPKVSEVLREIIAEILRVFKWPEGLKYQDTTSGQQFAYWVRPPLGICAVFNKKPLKGFSAETHTNPYRSKEPTIKITDAVKAEETLERAGVMLSWNKRLDELKESIKEAPGFDEESVFGLLPSFMQDAHLRRFVWRVEKPLVLEGEFGNHYRNKLPIELREAVINEQGCMMPDENKPRFLIITDCDAKNPEKIKKGFQTVIEAKFEDALYFIEQDRKKPLKDFRPQLEDIVYHRNLGPVRLMAERLEKLAKFAAEKLAPADKEAHALAARAGRLAKADLATATVNEFPYLEGIMGGYLLEEQQTEDKQENEILARAIREQNKPLGDEGLNFREDDTAKIVSLALFIACKVDHLASLTLCGEKPTGSSDPFNMRGHSLDLFRAFAIRRKKIVDGDEIIAGIDEAIITTLAHGLKLSFEDWNPDGKKPPGLAGAEAIKDRLLDDIKKIGFEYLVRIRRVGILYARAATTDKGMGFSILCAKALSLFAQTGEFESRLIESGGFSQETYTLQRIVKAATRVENIVRPVIDQDLPPPDPKRFTEEQEKNLYQRYEEIDPDIAHRTEIWWVDADCFKRLDDFTDPLAEFFEKVTVNHRDPELRDNRLALLLKIRDCYRRIADFPKLRTG